MIINKKFIIAKKQCFYSFNCSFLKGYITLYCSIKSLLEVNFRRAATSLKEKKTDPEKRLCKITSHKDCVKTFLGGQKVYLIKIEF